LHINTHIALGIIITLLYSYLLNPIYIEVFIVFCFSFLIDFDFILSKYAKNRNHRVLPTHGIMIYLFLIPFGFLLPIFFFLSVAGVVHVFIDCIDWGTAILSPFSKKIYFGILPKPPENIISEKSLNKRQCWFTLTYYKSKILMSIEIIIFIISIISIILINLFYWWFLIFYFLFLFIHLFSFYKCKNLKDK